LVKKPRRTELPQKNARSISGTMATSYQIGQAKGNNHPYQYFLLA
jgi:hypothetical protein